MVRIVWTEVSIEDLKEIFDYIAKDSVRYATIPVTINSHRTYSHRYQA